MLVNIFVVRYALEALYSLRKVSLMHYHSFALLLHSYGEVNLVVLVIVASVLVHRLFISWDDLR